MPAWNVYSDHALSIGLGRKNIRQITTITDIGCRELLQRTIRVAHAMYYCTQARQHFGWSNQEFFQLGSSLFIAPVADPDYVDLFATVQRAELLHICRFMECPGAAHAKPIRIDAADGFAKGEHAIHQMQVKLQYLSCASMGAMMAVMKQRDKAILLFQSQHAVHYLRVVPLMQQNDIYLSELLFKKLLEFTVAGFVKADVQLRIRAAKGINGFNGAFAFRLHHA